MKSENPLPKNMPVRGTVCAQYFEHKGRRYGPYWYRFWREGGKLHKRYVRPEELEFVRAQCEAERLSRIAIATLRKGSRQFRTKTLALLGEIPIG